MQIKTAFRMHQIYWLRSHNSYVCHIDRDLTFINRSSSMYTECKDSSLIKYLTSEYHLTVWYLQKNHPLQDDQMMIQLKVCGDLGVKMFTGEFTQNSLPDKLLTIFVELRTVFECFRDPKLFEIKQQPGYIKLQTSKLTQHENQLGLALTQKPMTNSQILKETIEFRNVEINALKEKLVIMEVKYQKDIDSMLNQNIVTTNELKSKYDADIFKLQLQNKQKQETIKQLRLKSNVIEIEGLIKGRKKIKKSIPPKIPQQQEIRLKLTNKFSQQNANKLFPMNIKSMHAPIFAREYSNLRYLGHGKNRFVVLNETIPKHRKYSFQIKLRKSHKNNIWIGIALAQVVDSIQINQDESVSYWLRNGMVWGTKSLGTYQNIQPNDIIQTEVQVIIGKVTWKTDNQRILASFFPALMNPTFKNRNQKYVPFIMMEDLNDTVEWMGSAVY